MSSDVLARAFWHKVAGELRGEAFKWWGRHESAVVGLAVDDARAVFEILRDEGDAKAAKIELAAILIREDRDAWRAYRDSTTSELRGISKRRAEMLDALEELAEQAARIIGAAVMGALPK